MPWPGVELGVAYALTRCGETSYDNVIMSQSCLRVLPHEISQEMVEVTWESILVELECECDSWASILVELELECDSMVVVMDCDSMVMVLECEISAVWEDKTYAHEHDTCTQCGGPP